MNNYNNDNEYGATDVDLREFDDVYAEAPADGDGRPNVPDGIYQVVVDKVELTRSKTSNSPMLKWQLRITTSQYTGRFLWKNNMLATAENIKWLKKDFGVCGFELAKLSDLPANLDRLLDLKLEVSQRTKGDYTNIYFQRLIATNTPNGGGGQEGFGYDDVAF